MNTSNTVFKMALMGILVASQAFVGLSAAKKTRQACAGSSGVIHVRGTQVADGIVRNAAGYTIGRLPIDRTALHAKIKLEIKNKGTQKAAEDIADRLIAGGDLETDKSTSVPARMFMKDYLEKIALVALHVDPATVAPLTPTQAVAANHAVAKGEVTILYETAINVAPVSTSPVTATPRYSSAVKSIAAIIAIGTVTYIAYVYRGDIMQIFGIIQEAMPAVNPVVASASSLPTALPTVLPTPVPTPTAVASVVQNFTQMATAKPLPPAQTVNLTELVVDTVRETIAQIGQQQTVVQTVITAVDAPISVAHAVAQVNLAQYYYRSFLTGVKTYVPILKTKLF